MEMTWYISLGVNNAGSEQHVNLEQRKLLAGCKNETAAIYMHCNCTVLALTWRNGGMCAKWMQEISWVQERNSCYIHALQFYRSCTHLAKLRYVCKMDAGNDYTMVRLCTKLFS